MTASGTNFSTVVSTWATPVSRAPAMFTSVNSQMAPIATAAASQFLLLTSPLKTPR